MNAPVDVLAVLRRTSEGLHGIADGCLDLDLATAMRERAREFDAACDTVAELVAELGKAHRIIRIALNTLPPDAKRDFFAQVVEAGLDGEGITRANEREALLARCGGAS